MAINFKIRKQAILSAQGKKTIFFATPVSNGETSLEHLQRMISRISAVSEGDVRSVLITLSQLIASDLSAGRIIDLGELGRLRVSLRSKSAAKGEDFKRTDITRVGVTFHPGALIREALQGAHLQRWTPSAQSDSIYLPKKEGEGTPGGGGPQAGPSTPQGGGTPGGEDLGI